MNNHEITIRSVGAADQPRPITALVVQPDRLSANTGVMLFTHGWGGNRFQHEDKMRWAADRYDVIAASVEFRQSGFDFDRVRGTGADWPYDASFFQVIDVLGVLRHLLAQPGINRRRVYHYGGSQGGHIALLAAIYAPHTFAWVYASCPLTRIDTAFQELAGRHLAPHEFAARDVLKHVNHVQCPVYLEYGDADLTVAPADHAEPLVESLRDRGILRHVQMYPGGGHDLRPTTDKLSAFQLMADRLPWDAVLPGPDDFMRGTRQELDCGAKRLRIDWTQQTHSPAILSWQ